MSKEIVGAAFPVPHHLMKRFFEEGKTVFVKNSKFSRLIPGSKIILSFTHRGRFMPSLVKVQLNQ